MRRVRARVRPGSPWVYANDLLDPPAGSLEPGEAVDVVDPEGRPLGRALANPHALIALRIYSREPVDLDDPAFYRGRIATALRWRRRVLPGRTALRVVAGEADGLGGLIVDRYGDHLSVQLTTLAIDRRAGIILDALRAELAPKGVVRRDDTGARALEGLGGEAQVWDGVVPERVPFEEEGVRMVADLVGGQKTGFFFDQVENRRFWRARAVGAVVLDAYANSGAWALQALAGGAREALALDSSEAACALVRENAALNGWSDRLTVQRGDVREVLPTLGSPFDLVSVDPPAFARNRKGAGSALHAYKQVSALGLATVAADGLYFASSCSHHVLPERFEEAVLGGARRAGRRVLLVHRGGQAPDHPILPGLPETAYLKHLVLLVRGEA